jgi:hypothetical protein
MHQKYIVFKNGSLEDIITFSELMGHDEIARNLRGNHNIVSAGFLDVAVSEDGDLTCVCFGKSTSLGIESRPEKDARVAMMRLYGNPY